LVVSLAKLHNYCIEEAGIAPEATVVRDRFSNWNNGSVRMVFSDDANMDLPEGLLYSGHHPDDMLSNSLPTHSNQANDETFPTCTNRKATNAEEKTSLKANDCDSISITLLYNIPIILYCVDVLCCGVWLRNHQYPFRSGQILDLNILFPPHLYLRNIVVDWHDATQQGRCAQNSATTTTCRCTIYFETLESIHATRLRLSSMGLGWECSSAGHHTLMVYSMHQARQHFDQDAAVSTPEAGACQPLPTKLTSKNIYCCANKQHDH
jgi:hypothetical protein